MISAKNPCQTVSKIGLSSPFIKLSWFCLQCKCTTDAVINIHTFNVYALK